MQWVLFLEVQGFYANILRQLQALPADRPAAVMRDGRVFDGCRLAFERGLQLGAPARQAARDCPGVALLEFEATDYGKAGAAWWNETLQTTPWVEPVAPHQVFIGLPVPNGGAPPLRPAGARGLQALPPSLRSEVAELNKRAAGFGFVTFTGVAPNKLVARAAAERVRSDWFYRAGKAGRERTSGEPVAAILPGEEQRFLASLPASALWPLPPPLMRRIGQLGLRTVGEIAAVPEGELVRQFGPAGRQLGAWAKGNDTEPVRPLWPPREEKERYVFGDAPAVDGGGLSQVVTLLAGKLSRTLARRHEGCLQVSLTLERPDGTQQRMERTLQKLHTEQYPLQQALLGLLSRAPAGEVSAITAGAGQIGPVDWQQSDLWGNLGGRPRLESEQRAKLEKALLTLHERFPSRVIGLGSRTEVPRRESMLQMIDPYRWRASGR